jgi:hypothetical protein
VNATVLGDAGELFGEILLWASGGYLSAVEFAWYGDEPPAAFPDVDAIRVGADGWRSGAAPGYGVAGGGGAAAAAGVMVAAGAGAVGGGGVVGVFGGGVVGGGGEIGAVGGVEGGAWLGVPVGVAGAEGGADGVVDAVGGALPPAGAWVGVYGAPEPVAASLRSKDATGCPLSAAVM